MNRLRYLCASAVLSLLLSACSSPHGQPQKRFGTCGAEPGRGLRHSLLTKLRGLSRRARTRRTQRSRLLIPFISPSLIKVQCAKSSPTAFTEPRCQLSLKAQVEC